MNKPFSMICEEFKQDLTNLINNSGLSAFVLESILQNYLNEVSALARSQYHLDKKKYEESLSKDGKEKEG